MLFSLAFTWLANIFSVIGAGIMIISGSISVGRFLKHQPWSIEGEAIKQIEKIRLGFGHKIVFGLEFLIVSDILRTLINPTSKDLIQLGGIVLIRTVLSYFISREMTEFHKHMNS